MWIGWWQQLLAKCKWSLPVCSCFISSLIQGNKLFVQIGWWWQLLAKHKLSLPVSSCLISLLIQGYWIVCVNRLMIAALGINVSGNFEFLFTILFSLLIQEHQIASVNWLMTAALGKNVSGHFLFAPLLFYLYVRATKLFSWKQTNQLKTATLGKMYVITSC